MKNSQWNRLTSILKGTNEGVPVGMIIDSPWLPGYCGMSTLDFYVRADEWMRAYQTVKRDFPDILFLPDWWVEYGMAAEPSGFGCKIEFFEDNLPVAHHIIESADDTSAIDSLKVPDPRKSGLMPLLLNFQRAMQPKIQALGEEIYIVNSRGPLTLASHLFSLTEFLVCMKIDPDAVHKLLRITTETCKRWLEAQIDNVGTARGILVLDDVTGFLGKDDYEEFAQPYLKDIFDSFGGMVKLFHNDTDNDTCYPYMQSLGIDLFNFTHKKDIGDVRQSVAKVCLLGNVPPMALAAETPETVYRLSCEVITRYREVNGNSRGLILSAGGGAPMGAKKENIEAMLRAARDEGNK